MAKLITEVLTIDQLQKVAEVAKQHQGKVKAWHIPRLVDKAIDLSPYELARQMGADERDISTQLKAFINTYGRNARVTITDRLDCIAHSVGSPSHNMPKLKNGEQIDTLINLISDVNYSAGEKVATGMQELQTVSNTKRTKRIQQKQRDTLALMSALD